MSGCAVASGLKTLATCLCSHTSGPDLFSEHLNGPFGLITQTLSSLLKLVEGIFASSGQWLLPRGWSCLLCVLSWAINCKNGKSPTTRFLYCTCRTLQSFICATVIEEWGQTGACVCMCGVLHLHLHLVLEWSIHLKKKRFKCINNNTK